MSWFWPFRKNTELPASVVSLTSGSTPKPSPVNSEEKVPASLRVSCSYATCGVPNAACLPVALFSCLPFGSFWQKKVPESLSNPPLEIRSISSPDSETLVTAVNETEEPVRNVAPLTEPATQASSPDAPQSPPQPPSA